MTGYIDDLSGTSEMRAANHVTSVVPNEPSFQHLDAESSTLDSPTMPASVLSTSADRMLFGACIVGERWLNLTHDYAIMCCDGFAAGICCTGLL